MKPDRRAVSIGLGASLAAGALARPAMAQSGLTARLQALEDRRAIEALRAACVEAEARGDARAVVACFTEDCLYEGPADRPGERDTVLTRRGLEAYLAARRRPDGLAPVLYNHIVELDGATAEGSCAIQPQSARGEVGFYVETLSKTDGRWRFQARRLFLYRPHYEI